MCATPLDRCRDEYLGHLSVERGLSRNTLEAYRRDLGCYLGYLAERGVVDARDDRNFVAAPVPIFDQCLDQAERLFREIALVGSVDRELRRVDGHDPGSGPDLGSGEALRERDRRHGAHGCHAWSPKL